MTEKRDDSSGMGDPIQKSIRGMIGLHNLGIEKASPPVGKPMKSNRDVSPINVTREGATAEEGKRYIDEERQALTDSVADYQRARAIYNDRINPKGPNPFKGDRNKPSRFYVDYDVDLFGDDDDPFDEHKNDPIPVQNVPDGYTFDFEEKYLDPGKYGGRAMYTDFDGDADPEEDYRATDYTWDYHEPTDQDVIDYKNEMREFAGDSGYWGVHEEMRPSEYLQATSSRKIDPKEFRPLNRWKDTDDALGDNIDIPIDKSGDEEMIQKSGNEGSTKHVKPADADDISDTGKTNGKQNVQGDWVSQDEAKEVTETNAQPAKNPIRKGRIEDLRSQYNDVDTGATVSHNHRGVRPTGGSVSYESMGSADPGRYYHMEMEPGYTTRKEAGYDPDDDSVDWPDPEYKEVTHVAGGPGSVEGYPSNYEENPDELGYRDYPSYSNDIDEFGMADVPNRYNEPYPDGRLEKSFDERVSAGLAYARASGELPSFRTIMKADIGEGFDSTDPETVRRAMKNSQYSKYKPRGKELKPIKNPKKENGEVPSVPMLGMQGNPEMQQAEPRGDYLNTTNKDRLVNPEHAQTMEGRKINPDKTNVRPNPSLTYEADRPRTKEEIDAAVDADKNRRSKLPKVEDVDHTNYTNPIYEGITGYSDPPNIDYTKPRTTPSQIQAMHADQENIHDEQGNAEYIHSKDAASHQGTGKAELSPYDIAAQQKAQKKIDNLRKKLELESRNLFGGPGLEGRRELYINNGIDKYIKEHNLGRILHPEGMTEERANQIKDVYAASAGEHERQKEEGLSPDEIVNQQVRNAKNREAGLKANEEEANALKEKQNKEREEWNNHVATIAAQKEAKDKADADERAKNKARNTAPGFESLNNDDRINRALQEQMEAHRASQEKKRRKQSEKDKAKASASKKDEMESPVENSVDKSGGSFREMMEYRMIEKASDRGYPSPYQVHVSDTLPLADTYRVVSMGDGKDSVDMRPRQADCRKR